MNKPTRRSHPQPQMDPLAVALNESNRMHCAGYGALLILLIDKGVFTQQEYDAALAQAMSEVDQAHAAKRDSSSIIDPSGS